LAVPADATSKLSVNSSLFRQSKKMASAIGDLQILPKQTNNTLIMP